MSLLHTSKDTEKIYGLEHEADKLQASLKLAKYDGLRTQMVYFKLVLLIG